MKRFLRKILLLKDKVLSPLRRQRLNNTNFSIISNNCWSGNIYRYFGLEYLSPTAGLYFWADDYIKFVSNLEYYLSLDMKFISFNDSKYRAELVAKNQCHFIIGKIDDVEIVFMHYNTDTEAKEKWDRRAKRVNFQNLIVKFSEMNGCTEEHLKKFDSLKYDKKVMFVRKPNLKYDSAVYYPGYDEMFNISNDTLNIFKSIDIVKLINR